MSGKAAPVGKGAAARGPGKKVAPRKDGVIISVEEKVWTLRMGARDPPCNVARFEEMWVGKGDSKRKVRPTAIAFAALRALQCGLKQVRCQVYVGFYFLVNKRVVSSNKSTRSPNEPDHERLRASGSGSAPSSAYLVYW